MAVEDKDLLMRRVAAYCAVIVVVGFFAIMTMQFFFVVPSGNKDGFNQGLGALILAFGGLMGYLYGSSKNSEAVSRAVTAMAVGAPVEPAPTPSPLPVEIQNAEPVDVAVVKPPASAAPAYRTTAAKKTTRRSK